MRLHLAVVLREEALAPLPVRRVRRYRIVRVVEAAILPIRAFPAARKEVGVERADVLAGWPAAAILSRLDVVATASCHLRRVHRVQLLCLMLVMLLLLQRQLLYLLLVLLVHYPAWRFTTGS